MQQKRKLLKGGIIVTDNQMYKSDLLIEGEKILQIAEDIDSTELTAAQQIIDVSGKLIMPGVIDPHTHFQLRSRNTITADDFARGSISAACGGVTTFIDYSDHLPGLSLKEAVNRRIAEARDQTVLDYTLHQTITHFDNQVSQQLDELLELGINSIKIFTTYRREGYMIPRTEWEQVFHRLRELQILPTVHAEDDELVVRREAEYGAKDQCSPEMHPKIRPAESEALAVEEIGNLGKKVGLPVYIAHLSSQVGCQALQRVKRAGGQIYAETTPHYLLLTEDKVLEPEAQQFIMTPPLRTTQDRQALWEGLRLGEIQLVATDHCSFTLEQKLADDNCLTILPGIPGSETMLPLIHHFGVGQGLFDYPQLVKILSTSAAKIFGLYPEKGSLLPGTDADIVVFDPVKSVVLCTEMLHSAAGYTPFDGIELTGYPIMTILRGEIIAREGEFCGQTGYGKFLKSSVSSLYCVE